MPGQTGSQWKAIGPGVLYAATAVGASHLVQSTRAGAGYGLALVSLILLTFIAKYPAFRFGAQYTSITGFSLLQGYRNQGWWAVLLYIIIALGTMFAAVPAVTLITAGLAKAAFGLQAGTMSICALILAGSAVILVVGGYGLLDRLVKVLMVALTVATLYATALVIPRIDWSVSGSLVPSGLNTADVFFIVALLGLMPTSVDISVWHSLWSVAKVKDSHHRPTLLESLRDFHVGYVGSFILAVCFVVLGAGVMHGSSLEFASGATDFATQFIQLYENTLGEWSGPLIGLIAVAVMFSTVLTGLDGYPRAAVSLINIYSAGKEGGLPLTEAYNRTIYVVALSLLVIGSLLVLHLLVTSLQRIVDFAATIIFLFAPIIAMLNHRVITGKEISVSARPSRGLLTLSLLGVLWLTAFSAYYLYLRFLQ